MKSRYNELLKIIHDRQEKEKNQNIQDDKKTDFNFCDQEGYALLHYAIIEGNLEQVENLIKNDANINLATQVIPLFESQKTPIHLALEHGHLNIAQFLFTQGALCQNMKLEFISDKKCREWFSKKIKKALQHSYAKLNLFTKQKDRFFYDKSRDLFLKLERAAEIGDIEFLDKNLKQVDKVISFPLLNLAAANGQIEVINYLLSTGISIDPAQSYKESALQAAIRSHQWMAVQYLLDHGARTNWQNNFKHTPLMVAIINNNLPAVKELISKVPLLDEDIEGNTILHHAMKTGNIEILNILLENKDIHSLLLIKNIYGHTPLNLANLFLREKIKIHLNTELENSNPWINSPPINHHRIIMQFRYYLRSQNRNMDLLPLRGHCNGLSYLYGLFEEEEEFFNILNLLAAWDGSDLALDLPFEMNQSVNSNLPNNLRELFEDWINQTVWFQQSPSLPFNMFNQSEHIKQHQFISNKKENIPLIIYENSNKDELISKEKMREILYYFLKMPPGTRLFLSGDGHSTIVKIKKDGLIHYYDPNFRHLTQTISDLNTLFSTIMDFKYILINRSPGRGIYFNFQFYYFSAQNKNFQDYAIFSSQKCLEPAHQFQQKSPAQFTQLMIAVMTRSLLSVKELLNIPGYDVNLKDESGNTAFQIAINNNFTQAIDALLYHPLLNLVDIDLDETMCSLYQFGQAKLAQTLSDRFLEFDPSFSGRLLIIAVKHNNIDQIKQLIQYDKIDISSPINNQLPLIVAMENNHPEMVSYLLDINAKITLLHEDETPLECAIKHERFYSMLINKLSDINEVDQKGNTALQYAVQFGKTEIVEDLLKRGAYFNIKNKK